MLFVTEDVARRVVSMSDAIETIESMFREYGRGEAKVFPVVSGHGPDPATRFSMKSGLMQTRGVVGLKVGSYWPGNRARGEEAHASSTLLLDPDTGYARALVAASHLTALRTAAADAVAVRRLARADSSTLAVIGAGHQAWFELLAIREVRPINKVIIVNRSREAAESFADRARRTLGLEAFVAEPREAVQCADIIVTVTAACGPLFEAGWTRSGSHVSAMGADGEGKQELDPRLVAEASLFADVVQQSVTVGEYEAAFKAGCIETDRITPLGAVLNGAPGRTGEEQITIFDSSGMALQDLAICSLALDKALEQGLATRV
ncbi:ornithine cyclodeaminase/mu-crystallin [Desulfovibrio sp. X2]|nr:ornithine cyclodeaminase/mu-crystallin [Desulfovibrio sp. X2]